MSEMNGDRRRSPRFACGGQAKISVPPSDGTVVSANLHNLSLGGICLDIDHPMDRGARTEVLVRVNTASFRSIGFVKALVEDSRACIEFVHMSACSKEILADLLAQLSRLQAVMAKLRSARAETDADLFQQLEEAGVRTVNYGSRVPWIGRTLNEHSSEAESPKVTEPGTSSQSLPLLIRVDFFG